MKGVSALMDGKASLKEVRTAFLVDGFNLYHSLDQAQGTPNVRHTKWLDLRAFCRSFLPNLGRAHRLAAIHYFSALATHIEAWKPDVTLRHQAYIRCLRETGVVVELGHFKQKIIRCPHCSEEIRRHEEKETDVAIGVRLLGLLWTGQCDAVVIVSADSDLAPAVRLANSQFPEIPIFSVMPYGRGSFDLRGLAAGTFRATKEKYTMCQLPDPFVCGDGTRIVRPETW